MSFTRRSAILTASAAALTVTASPALAAPFAWQSRSGLSTGQYQALFNQLTAQGYRLALVDGYNVDGNATFAAIFNQTGGPPWVAHHNMNAGQFQQTFDQLGAQGYRLTKVSGYGPGGVPLYAGLWTQSGGPAWQARSGLTSGQFQQVFNQLTAQGYRPVWVNGYNVAGVPYFAAIFEQIANSPAWISRHGMTAPQYQAAFDAAVAQGYHLRMVSGYAVGPVAYFAAIWDQGSFPAWQARHNLNTADFQAAFDALTQQGMRLVDVSGYEVGGQVLYAGLWING
jgi:hypothetical protein